MLVKRYHAHDMQQAMDTVIRELGSDAVILNSRKVRKKGLKNLFRKPVLEVMVAYDPASIPSAKKLNYAQVAYNAQKAQSEKAQADKAQPTADQPATSQAKTDQPATTTTAATTQTAQAQQDAAQPQASQSATTQKEKTEPSTPPSTTKKGQEKALDAVSNEHLARLDKRIDSIDNMLSDFMEKFSFVKREVTYDYPEDVQELLQRMIENQVREELAHSLAKDAELMMRKKPGASAQEVFEHLILEQLGRPSPILHKKFTQKVILVLGPTGVGKTTTIVKLAADFSVKQKKKIGIINTDTFRIGAQEQLQTYADIMGIPLQVVYRPDELEEALESMSDRDIVFIDTAGKRPGDEQHKEDILDIVRILRPEDILLCLAATTGFASIKEMVDLYGFVEGYKLLITKIDETKFRGALLNISWYTQRPLAYVTTGQNVPDDIEVVNVETIAKQIVSG